MIWTAPRFKLCFTYPKAIKCVCYFDGKWGCFCNLGLQFWPYSFATSNETGEKRKSGSTKRHCYVKHVDKRPTTVVCARVYEYVCIITVCSPEILWKDQPQRLYTVKIWGTSNPMVPHWNNKEERRWTGPTLERHKSCLIGSYLGI